MPENTITAPSQPAPQAPTSDAGKSNGPENLSVSDYTYRQFLKPKADAAAAEAASAATPPAPTTTEQPAPAVAPEIPAAPTPDPVIPAPEPHEDEDEALSQSTSQSGLPPELQQKVDKRIAKITAKRKDAERRAEAAEATLAQLAQANRSQPTAANPVPEPVSTAPTPLAKINTIQELQKLHNDATEAMRFAEYNLDRDDMVERQTEGGQVLKGVMVEGQFYTKAQLRDIKYNAQITKETDIPKRVSFLTAREAANQKAFELHPWLKDQGSPEYQMAMQAFAQNAWLQTTPDSLLLVGRMVLGAKAEAELAKGKVPPKPVPTRPRPAGDQTAVSSGAGPIREPVTTATRAALAQEDAKLAKGGNASAVDYAASLTRKAQLRKTL